MNGIAPFPIPLIIGMHLHKKKKRRKRKRTKRKPYPKMESPLRMILKTVIQIRKIFLTKRNWKRN